MNMWHGATRFTASCGGASARRRSCRSLLPWPLGRKMNMQRAEHKLGGLVPRDQQLSVVLASPPDARRHARLPCLSQRWLTPRVPAHRCPPPPARRLRTAPPAPSLPAAPACCTLSCWWACSLRRRTARGARPSEPRGCSGSRSAAQRSCASSSAGTGCRRHGGDRSRRRLHCTETSCCSTAVLTCDMRIGLQPGCTIIACAAPCCSLPSSKRRWRAVLARKAMECRVCALRTVCTRRTCAAHATCDMRIERAAAAVHAPCAVPASGAPRTVCRCHHRLDVADRVVLSLPKTFGWWQAAAALIARGTAVRWVAKVVARP